jgi:hypothetical protein
METSVSQATYADTFRCLGNEDLNLCLSNTFYRFQMSITLHHQICPPSSTVSTFINMFHVQEFVRRMVLLPIEVVQVRINAEELYKR